MNKPRQLVAFDEYGCFELTDLSLLELVSVDGLPVAGGDNAACYNGFCLNDVCVRYGSSNAVCVDAPPPPNPFEPLSPLYPLPIPDTPNLKCWMNNGCPPL
jgi:hypothetical protein